ncbi:helix-turn-helix domain-containing protein [Actinopolymorpha pittospori]
MNGSVGQPVGYDFLTRFVPRIVHVENRDRAFWRDTAYEITKARTAFHVLAYVHSGRGRLRVDTRVETLRTGTVFHFPAGIALNITVAQEDPACFYSIQYHYALVDWRGKTPHLQFAERRPLPLPPIVTTDSPGVEPVFARAYNVWSAAGLGYEWHARTTMLEALELLVPGTGSAPAVLPATTHAIDAAVDYIKTHLTTPLDRVSVAGRVGLSPAYFSTAFRRHTGYSFSGYVRGLRIDEAKRYLRTTSLSVAEIARRVGFRDPFHFSRVFRRATGVPPRDFRGF